MKAMKAILPLVSTLLCFICLVILAIDLFKPNLSVFLRPSVKVFVLITCILVIASCSVRLYDMRRRLRRKLARRQRS